MARSHVPEHPGGFSSRTSTLCPQGLMLLYSEPCWHVTLFSPASSSWRMLLALSSGCSFPVWGRWMRLGKLPGL